MRPTRPLELIDKGDILNTDGLCTSPAKVTHCQNQAVKFVFNKTLNRTDAICTECLSAYIALGYKWVSSMPPGPQSIPSQDGTRECTEPRDVNKRSLG